MTLDDLNTAEELLSDPDSEDNERFASRYGRSLIELARQALRAEPAGPESFGVPQDAKSNPSNGLVERVARIVDPEAFAIDPEVFATRIYGSASPGKLLAAESQLRRRTTDALSKAREIHALYQQEGVLSSQRGQGARMAHLLGRALERGDVIDPDMLERIADLIDAPTPKITDADREWARQVAGMPEVMAGLARETGSLSPPIAPASQRGGNRSANASLRPTLHDADTEALPPGPVKP